MKVLFLNILFNLIHILEILCFLLQVGDVCIKTGGSFCTAPAKARVGVETQELVKTTRLLYCAS